MELSYNVLDKGSIIEFAKLLKNKSLREACANTVLEHGYQGKGNFGQILEKHYFQYEPNSESEADFEQVGLELKSSPLKLIKKGDYRAKERLVLNIINYLEEIDKDFESSSFWRKNAGLLLVFYLHKLETNVLDYVIHLVDEWRFPEVDLEIIKKDWQTIQDKIIAGRAHELSEGDTFYLGACTKGSKGGNERAQPNNTILAKQRAYSLKQGYVNHIIATLSKGSTQIYGKLIQSTAELEKQSLEDFVISKIQPNYGKSIEELTENLNRKINIKAKSFNSIVVNAMLGIELGKKIEEFEKADIVVKTVKLQKNNMSKECISFPSFKYEELVKENWEDSSFKALLEQKFLFVFFKEIEGVSILMKAVFWNMPYKDLLEAKKVWLHTQKLVKAGHIVRETKQEMRSKSKKSTEKEFVIKRITYFSGKSENRVAHVRPHGKNANDTYPLPLADELTGESKYTKHCFWLNNDYVRDEIYLK